MLLQCRLRSETNKGGATLPFEQPHPVPRSDVLPAQQQEYPCRDRRHGEQRAAVQNDDAGRKKWNNAGRARGTFPLGTFSPASEWKGEHHAALGYLRRLQYDIQREG